MIGVQKVFSMQMSSAVGIKMEIRKMKSHKGRGKFSSTNKDG